MSEFFEEFSFVLVCYKMAVKCHVNVKTEAITGNIYEFSNCCGPSVFLTLFFINLFDQHCE